MNLKEPVMATYVISASIMLLKIMGQGWITVYCMLKIGGGFLNPEDNNKGLANPIPRPGQLDTNDYVERSRRMHRNDVENILPFLVAGLLFVLTNPSLILAQLLLYGFVLTRAGHFIAYFNGWSHEVRATFFTAGSMIIIGMAIYTIKYTIF
jgi:glutathione S-transferase